MFDILGCRFENTQESNILLQRYMCQQKNTCRVSNSYYRISQFYLLIYLFIYENLTLERRTEFTWPLFVFEVVPCDNSAFGSSNNLGQSEEKNFDTLLFNNINFYLKCRSGSINPYTL